MLHIPKPSEIPAAQPGYRDRVNAVCVSVGPHFSFYEVKARDGLMLMKQHECTCSKTKSHWSPKN
jgi:hypothetical protein